MERFVLMPPLVDIHTHGAGCIGAVRVVSVEAGGPLPAKTEGVYLALGVHPWLTGAADLGERLAWVASQCTRPDVLAIGECGLDRLRGAALSVQMEVFMRQIRLAESLGKPLIIHCVRAFGELVGLKRKLRVSVPMIVHGFNQRARIGQQLLAEGFWLSFGTVLLETRSAAAALFPNVPEDRLFLETDAASLEIEAVYAAAAKLRGMVPDELRAAIWKNFLTVLPDER